MSLTYQYHNFITGYGLQSNFSPNWKWKYENNAYYFDGHHHFYLENVSSNVLNSASD